MRNIFKKVILPQSVRFAGGPVVFRPRFPWLLSYRPVNMFAEVYYLFPLNYLVRWWRLARNYAWMFIARLIINFIRRHELYAPRPQGSLKP